MMSLVEEELGGPTVFKDLARLDFDYVPDELPNREDAIRFLSRTYRGLTQGGTREHALLWGPVGTGKTVVAKRFARDLATVLARQGKRLEAVHVNCRKRKSAGLATLGIVQHFEPHYPERGFSVGEMLRDLRKQLERRECHLLVILDEVDALLRADGSNLVYDLTRFNDEIGSHWVGVSLILISQQQVLDQLDDAALSTFKRGNVHRLEPYGVDEMRAIVGQRVELAFRPGTVEEDSIDLVADIAGEAPGGARGGPGDARLGIELLWKSGVLADDDQTNQVTPEHVRAAKAETYSVVTETKLRNLNLHPLLVLKALARRLSRDGGAYAITGRLEETYKIVCEEHNETPRGHTQFWKYLKQLEDAGFMQAKISGKGHAGTTQLLSLPDVPAKVLLEKVETLVRDAKNPNESP
jgi:archaeal cell division control protein 6